MVGGSGCSLTCWVLLNSGNGSRPSSHVRCSDPTYVILQFSIHMYHIYCSLNDTRHETLL
ncbi:hypothetical protein PF005_g14599 [Phytophthora fragariae]|uniref:Uncharacterized protein n=1 Tax=Phytophthora fragariae TaxID=53985 RepID=A0A6A3YHQ3_9STRA|nr:hypothetical protein PF003_g11688 [Phytophthora fragariae]KAE8934857.1 hypothetical protein PF009_g15177 [Phytophthora fragariae]KAE8997931.1 hypothetical protein PF011_g15263 [Phytophthora fragariae]KAE9100236.1 hypothetical protein PF010_g14884 [Phytophthora fragariae]KAE9102088.1 hypothetical protein PF007_g14878 [Phytophthora fragariae]